MKVKMMRLEAVKGQTGLSRSTIYSLVAAGKFPRQVVLTPGGRCVGWLESDVEAYLSNLLSTRWEVAA